MDGEPQVTMILRRRSDGRFCLSTAVGEAGRDHARAVNAQTYEIDDALAAALLSSASMAVVEHNAPLAQSVFRYFDREHAG